MFCEQCGAPIPEGARFCEQCGAPVEQASAPAPAPAPAPVPKPEPVPEPKPQPKPAPAPRRGESVPNAGFSTKRLVIGTLVLLVLAFAAYYILAYL